MKTDKISLTSSLQQGYCNDYCISIVDNGVKDEFEWHFSDVQQTEIEFIGATMLNNKLNCIDLHHITEEMKYCFNSKICGQTAYIIAILKYNSERDYETGDIVLKDGKIMRAFKLLRNGVGEYLWVEVDIQDILDAEYEDMVFWNTITVSNCCVDSFIYPIACNQFVFKPNTTIIDIGEIVDVKVKKLDNTVVYSYSYTPEDVYDVHGFQANEDGIYIVSIKCGFQFEYKTVIYVLCKTTECYKKMIDKLLCRGKILCEEKEADCPTDKDINYEIYWVNMFQSLWTYLISIIEIEQNKFTFYAGGLGLQHSIGDRINIEVLKEINKIFNMLYDMVAQCGGCSDIGDESYKPCYDCDYDGEDTTNIGEEVGENGGGNSGSGTGGDGVFSTIINLKG